MNKITHPEPFKLEGGAQLSNLHIAYYTYGQMNATKDNVIWICHALTGNADAADWWSGLVGEDKLFDPAHYFIVCANMLGSCYGTTGPDSKDPETGKPYGKDFPMITVRDMVKAHQLLAAHLEIGSIQMALGGSMGGQQVLEWAIMEPERLQKICLLATNARHSPWGIAFNEAQRMAIEADPTIYDGTPQAGKSGLEAARAVAMLSYRNYGIFGQTQDESSADKINGFRASSYQRYQGLKLHQRFTVLSYLCLSKAMDSHNVGRGRIGVEEVLSSIKANTLVIGIQSDILFPIEEQILIANQIPNAKLEIIESKYGHDGFLIENEIIKALIFPFLTDQPFDSGRAKYRLHTSAIDKRSKDNFALPGTESF